MTKVNLFDEIQFDIYKQINQSRWKYAARGNLKVSQKIMIFKVAILKALAFWPGNYKISYQWSKLDVTSCPEKWPWSNLGQDAFR